MSTTSHNCKIINFEERRREYVIRELIRRQIHEPEEIAQLLQFHEFLIYMDAIEDPEETLDEETLSALEGDIQFIREKFNELFEIIK